MKKLLIAAGFGISFTLLSIFSAKADAPNDRDHGRFRDRDRREWRDGDRREWRDGDRYRDRHEWREHERYERYRYYDRCRPRVYFHW